MRVLLENLTSTDHTGWHRVTVHQRPVWDAATLNGRKFVVGQPLGVIGYGLDVYGHVPAGARITLDLTAATPTTHTLRFPPEAELDPIGYFGLPSVLGAVLGVRSITPDGACLLVHLGARVGALFVDLWLRVCPGQSRYNGTLRLTCSDITSSTLWAELPDPVLDLPRGFRFADGQAVSRPVQWQRDTKRLVVQPIILTGRGIDTVGWLGIAPRGGFDLTRWLIDRHDQAAAALSSWRLISTGITPNAAVAGDQDDAGYAQGFESFYGGTLKGIATNWLAAHQWAKRPCHHLHPDGRIVDPEQAGAYYWNGRPWTVRGNQFEKPRSLAEWDCSGWYGPDLEHHFVHRLAAAYELTQDPGLQHELEHLAYVFLGAERTEQDLALSRQFVSRALGWNSLVAAHLYRLLSDRALAERIKARWLARVEMHRQRWGVGFWDVRETPSDSLWLTRSESPHYCMLYQMAVGAFGVYAAADVFGAPAQRQWALDAAAMVVGWAWDANLTEWEIIGFSGPTDPHAPVNYREGTTAHRSGFYRGAWLPLAAWVVRDGSPGNEKSLAVWDRIMRDVAGSTEWHRVGDWTPPLRGTA